MTFEKHLRWVSNAASQRLSILWKFWRVFHNRSLFGRCFRGFILPILEYCYAVWCSAADTHIKLLDYAVSGARFLTGDMIECDIAHRRFVAVLCMLYIIIQHTQDRPVFRDRPMSPQFQKAHRPPLLPITDLFP